MEEYICIYSRQLLVTIMLKVIGALSGNVFINYYISHSASIDAINNMFNSLTADHITAVNQWLEAKPHRLIPSRRTWRMPLLLRCYCKLLPAEVLLIPILAIRINELLRPTSPGSRKVTSRHQDCPVWYFRPPVFYDRHASELTVAVNQFRLSRCHKSKNPAPGRVQEIWITQCSFRRGRITRLILPTSIIRPVLK